MILCARLATLTAALSVVAAGLWLEEPVLADEPAGVAQLGDSYCPPCPPDFQSPGAYAYPPSFSGPFAPQMPTTPAPGQSTPMTPARPQIPGAQQQPGATSQPPGAASQQPTAPAQAPPTFLPSPTTAATSAQALAPNSIGDFFGPTTLKPIIRPGEIVNQAVFFDPPEPPVVIPGKGPIPPPPDPFLNYFRIVNETAPNSGIYTTDTDVLLGTGKSGVVSASLSQLGKQLLTQYDGSTFTGERDDLGPVTDPGPFVALNSGTRGTIDLLAPEDPNEMTTLLNQPIYNIHDAIQVFIPTPGANVGRQKIVENNSVFPRDRVFLNYSAFTNVPLSATGENVHRFVPGFEMAFLEEQMSLEVRLPFAATLDSDIRAGGLTARNELEFGNMVTTLKMLVRQNENSATAIGCSLALPTAADVTVRDFFGEEFISMENNSLHVMPWVGAAVYEGRWFAQGYLQGDIDTTGYRVLVRNDSTGNFDDAGELYDAAFVYCSASVGYWIYQNGYTQTNFAQEGNRTVKKRVVARDYW
ncbi:MAG: hypothetical protein KF861_16225, partial [Planctomycetaceae bacterium]|nr:hypothetical protein [Planctomycetaceae bacterium]